MSRKEVPRAGLVKAALAGKIPNREGAQALRLSVRQFQRLKGRVRAEGAAGIVHRSRGRVSPRRLAPALRKHVVRLMTTLYEGFNDVHLTEKLHPHGDRAGIFQRNDPHWSTAEQLRGERDPTHFGVVLRDLGIGFIAAQSPQAKGRIERLWETLQGSARQRAAVARLPHPRGRCDIAPEAASV